MDGFTDISKLYFFYWTIFWISSVAQVLIVITFFKVMVNWMPQRFSIWQSLVSFIMHPGSLLLFVWMFVMFIIPAILA